MGVVCQFSRKGKQSQRSKTQRMAPAVRHDQLLQQNPPESGHRPTRRPLHSCVWDASDSRARIEWQVLASQRLAPFRSRARAWGGRLWQGLRVSPQRRGASPLADGESAKTAVGTPILWEFPEAATAQPTVVPMEGRGPYRVSGAHRPLHSCHGTSVPVEEPSTASIADIRGL
jgi:hypothetical protein